MTPESNSSEELVLSFLAEAADDYVSGEAISDKLGLTRAAVWAGEHPRDRILAVCGDPTVGDAPVRAGDLPCPVTRDPAKIAAWRDHFDMQQFMSQLST